MRFRDRREAGRALAERLHELWGQEIPPGLVVLGLPRGGVPVGDEIARAFDVALDVLVVRKVGLPGHREFGVGAVTGEGPPLFDRSTLAQLRLTEEQLAPVVERERAEVHRREALYRQGRQPPAVAGRPVVVVDDGLATGSTARAALRKLRRAGAGRLTLAVPVGAPEAREAMRAEADEVVGVYWPREFRAVGLWYDDFDQLTDDDVLRVLRGVHR